MTEDRYQWLEGQARNLDRMTPTASERIRAAREAAEATQTQIDFDARYRVAGYGAIAWYLLGYELIRDEDYEWSGIEEENRDMVRAVMVGDDRVHLIDVEDLELLDDLDYCASCGQIGCTHDGRDRS